MEREELNWECPARVDQVDLICKEAHRVYATHHLSRKDWFGLELLLREALVNAIVHGSQSDPKMTVRCRLSVSDQEAWIEVADDGPGFDWRSGLGTSGSEDGESGRGLAIYRLYARSFSFNELGNQVTLRCVFMHEGEAYGR
jgi:anti-sigma regulatory factor (Ser/Thr protein kinase)